MDVQLPDGTILRDVPDGTTKAQLVAKLQSNGYDTSKLDPAVSAGQAINSTLGGIPRQLGLTARHAIEGLADGAQLLTEPIRYITDKLTPDRQKTLNDLVLDREAPPKSMPLGVVASQFSDWLGLPKPETPTERAVATATKLGFGTAGNMFAAGMPISIPKIGSISTGVPEVSNLLQYAGAGNNAVTQSAAPKLAELLRQAPTTQLLSAAGAGLAGGASKEAGGGTGTQVAASVLGGLGGAGVASLGQTVQNVVNRTKNALMTPKQMDTQLTAILERSGIKYEDVPEKVRQSLRQELGSALKAEQELDPASVARLLDFKLNNLTPTRGMVSLDPVQITKEQNLAKIAANASDGELHGLPRLQNQNNAQLITNLNNAGANTGSILGAGNRVTSSILGTQSGLRNAEQAAWDAAKGSPGYRQPISSSVLSDVNAALGNEGLMPFMNPTISKYIEAFQNGHPFTPMDYRNLQSMLARETAKGGNEGAAAALARRILEQAELKPAGLVNNNAPVPMGLANQMRAADANAADSISLVNDARNATRKAYAYEDSSPLVRSVLSGGSTSDPQRIAQRFVIGGTSNEAEELARQVGPQGFADIKNAILNHLKEKALNGASDEVGKFSQSAFNKALKAIGDRKLQLFFSPEEINQLQSMGRAASYMQAQPVGSAVNNSNSGALVLGRGMDWLRKTPILGENVAPSLERLIIGYKQNQAQKVLPGLLSDIDSPSVMGGMVAPGLAFGGLLAAP